jgi:signal transduction histidine kinase
MNTLQWLGSRSLGTKFAFMVVSILIMSMSVGAYVYLKAQHKLLLDNLLAKGNALGSFVSLISPQSILAFDFERMQGYMREVTLQEDIVYAVIVSSNGINLTQYLDKRNKLVSEALESYDADQLLEVIKYLNAKDSLIALKFPVTFDSKPLGHILIGVSRERIDAGFKASLMNILLVIVLSTVLISLAIIYGFRYMAMTPINKLTEGFGKVAGGNLADRIDVHSHDELGKLTESFNEMVEHLDDTIKQKDSYAEKLTSQAEEMRVLRDEAVLANQHKSEFLAMMSHELRTPLNAIIGFSDVLNEKMFGELNDKQSEYVTDINASGHHLLSLINDILDLSKVDAGRMELEKIRFDLPLAISNAMTLVKERAERHGIMLQANVDESLGEFVADERKFKQILLNLLSNAVKFTPVGGKISISARKSEEGIYISVADTGRGIAKSELGAVFEDFYQTKTTGETHEGTGLGLSLCKKFVELHGGNIEVDSEPGKGSVFTFFLPNG